MAASLASLSSPCPFCGGERGVYEQYVHKVTKAIFLA